MSSEEEILFAREGALGLVTLNRPKALNALTHEMCLALDAKLKEWETDEKPFYPSHGYLQFAHGTDAHYSVSNFMVRPRVGDFYVFPSYMFHCVYPFRTKGERRSFSMNLSVDEAPV